jgi:hypothetical protein
LHEQHANYGFYGLEKFDNLKQLSGSWVLRMFCNDIFIDNEMTTYYQLMVFKKKKKIMVRIFIFYSRILKKQK